MCKITAPSKKCQLCKPIVRIKKKHISNNKNWHWAVIHTEPANWSDAGKLYEQFRERRQQIIGLSVCSSICLSVFPSVCPNISLCFCFVLPADRFITHRIISTRQTGGDEVVKQTAFYCDQLKAGAYPHIIMFKIHSNYASWRREIDSKHFSFFFFCPHLTLFDLCSPKTTFWWNPIIATTECPVFSTRCLKRQLVLKIDKRKK